MFSMMPSTGTFTFLNMASPRRASIKDRSCGVEMMIAPFSGTFCASVSCASPVPGGMSTTRTSSVPQARDRDHLPVVIELGLFADAREPRHRRTVDIGVEQPDLQTEVTQAEREIECGGRFADAALAGSDGNHSGNAGNFGLPRHRRAARTLWRTMCGGRRHAMPRPSRRRRG